MREEPLNYDFDPHKFLLEHGEEMEQGIIHEEDVSDILDFLLEMSISDIRAVKSHLTILYQHLLKYQYQKDHQTRSWINTIRRTSRELSEIVEDSKSISNKITPELQNKAYENAKKYASVETLLPITTFPKTVPYIFDNIINIYKIEEFLSINAFTIEAKNLLSGK